MTNEEIQAIRNKYQYDPSTLNNGVNNPSLNTISVSDFSSPEVVPQEKTFGQKAIDTTKAFVGGVGEGIGGIALTGIQKGGEALVNKFGTEQMKQNIANAPTLREQFKTQMGAEQNPVAYGLGEMTGQVASLAAPVGAVGGATKAVATGLGVGAKTSKILQAGAEGAAFTKGMELQSGEKQTGSDYAINTALNVAFPVAGIVGKGLAENVAPRIVNSLIKPLAKDFAYEKNPGKAVAELGITGNSWDELISNITSAKEKIGQSIGQVINKSQNLQQIDLSQTLKPIDEAISNAYKTPRTNATLISRLEGVKQDLVDNLQNGIDPQSFKGLVGDLTKWTGNVSDDQLVNKSLKQVYGSTRSAMDDVLKKELTPEQFAGYKKASEQYGNLMSAENAAKYRDKVVERQDLISFGAKNAGLLSALGTAIATGGAGVPTILAGLAGAGIEKGMATPAFKTRLAKLLTKLAPKEVNTFFDKVPTAKSLFNEGELQDMVGGAVKEAKANPLRGSVTPSEFLPKKVSSLKNDPIYKNFTQDIVGTSKVEKDDLLNVKDSGRYAWRAGRDASVLVDNADLPDNAFRSIVGKSREDVIKSLEENMNKFNSEKTSMPPTDVKKINQVIDYVERVKFELLSKKKVATSLEQEAKKYKSAEDFVKAKTNAYHGSYTDIKKFEKGYFGDTTANNEAEVFYFTKSPKHATEYSREAFARRFEGDYDEKYYKKLGGEEMMKKLYEDAGANIQINPSFVDIKKPKVINWKGESLAGKWEDAYDMIRTAKSKGYDGVIFKNISDDVNPESLAPQDVVIAFEPEQIMTKSQLTDIWKKANRKASEDGK